LGRSRHDQRARRVSSPRTATWDACSLGSRPTSSSCPWLFSPRSLLEPPTSLPHTALGPRPWMGATRKTSKGCSGRVFPSLVGRSRSLPSRSHCGNDGGHERRRETRRCNALTCRCPGVRHAGLSADQSVPGSAVSRSMRTPFHRVSLIAAGPFRFEAGTVSPTSNDSPGLSRPAAISWSCASRAR